MVETTFYCSKNEFRSKLSKSVRWLSSHMNDDNNGFLLLDALWNVADINDDALSLVPLLLKRPIFYTWHAHAYIFIIFHTFTSKTCWRLEIFRKKWCLMGEKKVHNDLVERKNVICNLIASFRKLTLLCRRLFNVQTLIWFFFYDDSIGQCLGDILLCDDIFLKFLFDF